MIKTIKVLFALSILFPAFFSVAAEQMPTSSSNQVEKDKIILAQSSSCRDYCQMSYQACMRQTGANAQTCNDGYRGCLLACQ
jgi:hypothetical protein